jgi:citrate lyase beta subunit
MTPAKARKGKAVKTAAPVPPARPRLRSVLYTPGDRGERIEKALREGLADAVIADLEDAVAPDRKAEARKQVLAAWKAVPRSRSLRAVRINPWPGAAAKADLAAVLPGRPDFIAVPKCESVPALKALDRLLAGHERKAKLPRDSIGLLVIVETAQGVVSAPGLASACKRTVAIAFGAEDLAADVGMRRSPSNWEVGFPRSMVALAAAVGKVQALDMITADPKDAERAGREAHEARALGYSGKMCIHPAQVPAVHAAFAPTADELAWARRVLGAVESAGIGAGGVVVVDGKMVDVPFIEQARRVLRDAA